MKKGLSFHLIVGSLCLLNTPVRAQPISAPQQGSTSTFSPQQQPVYRQQQPTSPVYRQQQPVSPLSSPAAALAAIPLGSVEITEKITPTTANKTAIMQFEISPSGRDGKRAVVSLDSVEPFNDGSLLVRPSAITFDLVSLQNYQDGFVAAIDAANRAKQQGLSGFEKVVHQSQEPNGNFQRFTLKIGTNGEPRIVVEERTRALSIPLRNPLGYTIPELQAFQRLLDRMPEAQQKLVQGSQL